MTYEELTKDKRVDQTCLYIPHEKGHMLVAARVQALLGCAGRGFVKTVMRQTFLEA